MALREYGPGVSQTPQPITLGDQFSGEERSYEHVVILDNAPCIDWEFNLRTEVADDYGYVLNNSRNFPSCWVNNDFLENPVDQNSYTFLPPIVGNENKLNLAAANLIVHGWTLRFEYSDTSSAGTNLITLPAPPLAGGRTDLVILEVWRALISAIPNLDNKSPAGLIVRHGNIKAPDLVNLTDDLIDPIYAAESSRRVQIQYRYRVIPGVNITTYPDGLDDPIVFANTVSDFAGPGADGTVTALNYVPVAGDNGLWVAGLGTAVTAATLGTVDGFMYAIPIAAVFRRNTTAFDRTINLNGGVLIGGVSDRPDGLFSDQIIREDVKNLRKGVAYDLHEVLEKNSDMLLTNTLSTEHQTISGVTGTGLLVEDSITLGTHIGNSDQVRMIFSDRAILQPIVCHVAVAAGPGSFVLSLAALPIRQGAADAFINVAFLAPAGTAFHSTGEIRRVQALAPIDIQANLGTEISSIVVTPGLITINYTAAIAAAADFFVTVYIEYPAGNGLSHTPNGAFQLWSPPAAALAPWVDPAILTATIGDPTRFSVSPTLWAVETYHRELQAHFTTLGDAVTYYTDATGIQIHIPERIDSIVAPVVASFTFNSAYTTVTLVAPLGPDAPVLVTYIAQRALPPVVAPPNDSYNMFYETNAVQTLDVPAGNVSLECTARAVLPCIETIVAGTGTEENPFAAIVNRFPNVQIPIAKTPSPSYPESYLDTTTAVVYDDTPMTFGYLEPNALLKVNPSYFTLVRQAGDNDIDAEGRSFWPRIDALTTIIGSGSKQFAFPNVHKTAWFVLGELRQDFASIGRKGTLILVCFTSFNDFNIQNNALMFTTPSDVGAGVYRVRGNLLNPRRSSP